MKALLKLTIVVLMMVMFSGNAAAESPFTKMWRAIGGGTADTSTGVVECVIQNRDFRHPPRVEEKSWRVPCVLEARLTTAQLANVRDPAKFLNARRTHAIKPTRAVWIANGAEHPLNSERLIDAETAKRIYVHLIDWGCTASLAEMDTFSPVVRLDWRGETRRWWMAGSIDVGTVTLRIASDVIERAESETRAEIARGSCRAEE